MNTDEKIRREIADKLVSSSSAMTYAPASDYPELVIAGRAVAWTEGDEEIIVAIVTRKKKDPIPQWSRQRRDPPSIFVK